MRLIFVLLFLLSSNSLHAEYSSVLHQAVLEKMVSIGREIEDGMSAADVSQKIEGLSSHSAKRNLEENCRYYREKESYDPKYSPLLVVCYRDSKVIEVLLELH